MQSKVTDVSVDEKIKIIQEKLAGLLTLDNNLEIFGASSHKYQINPTLSEKEISTFEQAHSISLPDGYRVFLKNVGNGGAGPYYGLQKLEDSIYADLDYKRPGEIVDPSIPFPFQEPWNMVFQGDEEDEEAYEKHEEAYFSGKWETGILRICNYGCGVSLNLVVNGNEKGNIWVDDRGNDGGIFPDPYFEQTGKTAFLDWYELWLDLSLKELEKVSSRP